MSRPFRIFAAGALAVALAALAVPVGMHPEQALFGADVQAKPASAAVPAAQRIPAALAGISGVKDLSDHAPQPSGPALASTLDASLDTGGAGSFTASVLDAATGATLYSRGAEEPRTPASNLKLLTAATVLRNLGAQTRFETQVLQGSSPSEVVLKAGGDVLLGDGDSQPEKTMGHAGLGTLAKQTAASLKAAGVAGTVSVALDDSLFSGPSLNPAWDPGDVAAGEVAPVFPLALNSARYAPDSTYGPRPQDAARTAETEFVARLRDAGIDATLGSRRGAGAARSGAAVLAQVQSATVVEQVGWMLENSDNYLAETLARMAAVSSGAPGSITAALAAMRATADGLGIPSAGLTLLDSCGLTLGDKISTAQLAAVVRAIVTSMDQDLRAGIDGFPVAGLSGTLDDRYGDVATAGGRGLVRAKTGTLNTVLSLSGFVVDADGRLLVFSFVGNDLAPGSKAAKAALDRSATALAGCGCR